LRIDGNKVIVEFETEDSPLVNKGESATGFEIAGADGKFVPADGAVKGNTVVLTASGVASPASVRYGWDDDPACSIFNQANLPAAPFKAP
jgi:sialate O-acetylesterase